MAAFVTEIEVGEYIDPSEMKFAQFAENWKEKYAYRQLAAKTIELYDFILDRYMLPAFGSKKIESFLPMHITDYIIYLESTRLDGKEGGLSTSTIEKHTNLLNSIFNFAIKNQIIKVNPVENAVKPVVRYKQREVYTIEEVEKLYTLLEDVVIHQSLMVKLAIDTGMRRGEILALEWEKINFKTNTIQIWHSLSYTKKEGYQIKSTKYENKRTVKASHYLMNKLKKYHDIKINERSQASELWEGGKYFFVFSNWDGKPFHPDTPSTWWDRFLKRNKFKRITFHDLRHTAATIQVSRGTHPKVISERLGHGDIKVTMNTYAHYIEEADQKAADSMDSIYANFK